MTNLGLVNIANPQRPVAGCSQTHQGEYVQVKDQVCVFGLLNRVGEVNYTVRGACLRKRLLIGAALAWAYNRWAGCGSLGGRAALEKHQKVIKF